MAAPAEPELPTGPDAESPAWVAALSDDGRARGDAARREPSRPAPARRAHRDPPPARLYAAPTWRRLSMTSPTRARTTPCSRSSPSSTLPGREPIHHLGVQVRAARGGREAAPARVAGPRDSDRVGALGRPRRPRATRRRAAPRAARSSARSRAAIADGAFAASARRCWSPSRSTACRSTCSPSGWTTTRGALYKTIHDARRKLRARACRAGAALRSGTRSTEVTR